MQPDELHIDRGYITSPMVNEVLDNGGQVLCKPWAPKNGELFAKSAFKMDMRSRQLTCPAGQTVPFTLGSVVEFDAKQCDTCPLRAQCTTAAKGHGRTVSIAEDEPLQHRLRKRVKSPSGRERLRERVGVEHRLAHLSRRQGLLWEIKTHRFDTYNAFIRRMTIQEELPLLREERDIAAACGYDFVVGVSTQAHKDALLAEDQSLNIVVTGCKR